MSTFVKICGLARQQDVEATAALQPDAMGFIFYSGSPRVVTPAEVAAWTRNVPAGILKVGIFVDHRPEDINTVVQEAGLDAVQFSGPYEAEAIAQVNAKHWEVLHTAEVPDDSVRGVSDAFLLDSKDGDRLGGTGVVGDWNSAKEFVQDCDIPVWLAGGLSPDNVKDAIRTVQPYGVDVVTGTEASPGVKDMDKVAAFINRSRSA